MIAQDGKHAVGSMEPLELGHEGLGFFGASVHQIAREANQVGFEVIDGLGVFGNKCGVVAIGAQM